MKRILFFLLSMVLVLSSCTGANQREITPELAEQMATAQQKHLEYEGTIMPFQNQDKGFVDLPNRRSDDLYGSYYMKSFLRVLGLDESIPIPEQYFKGNTHYLVPEEEMVPYLDNRDLWYFLNIFEDRLGDLDIYKAEIRTAMETLYQDLDLLSEGYWFMDSSALCFGDAMAIMTPEKLSAICKKAEGYEDVMQRFAGYFHRIRIKEEFGLDYLPENLQEEFPAFEQEVLNWFSEEKLSPSLLYEYLYICNYLGYDYALTQQQMIDYLQLLENEDGGYGIRPGAESNAQPLYYVAEICQLLGIDRDFSQALKVIRQNKNNSGLYLGYYQRASRPRDSYFVYKTFELLGQLEKEEISSYLNCATDEQPIYGVLLKALADQPLVQQDIDAGIDYLISPSKLNTRTQYQWLFLLNEMVLVAEQNGLSIDEERMTLLRYAIENHLNEDLVGSQYYLVLLKERCPELVKDKVKIAERNLLEHLNTMDLYAIAYLISSEVNYNRHIDDTVFLIAKAHFQLNGEMAQRNNGGYDSVESAYQEIFCDLAYSGILK